MFRCEPQWREQKKSACKLASIYGVVSICMHSVSLLMVTRKRQIECLRDVFVKCSVWCGGLYIDVCIRAAVCNVSFWSFIPHAHPIRANFILPYNLEHQIKMRLLAISRCMKACTVPVPNCTRLCCLVDDASDFWIRRHRCGYRVLRTVS